MLSYDKPLPQVTKEAKPFWDACKQHKLIVQRCNNCGYLQHYPRLICRKCWSDSLEWAEMRGTGTIYSFTVVHRAPSRGFRPDVPYVVALIDLDEGVRLMSNVVGCKPEDVHIGMSVRVKFDDVTEEMSLPKFIPHSPGTAKRA